MSEYDYGKKWYLLKMYDLRFYFWMQLADVNILSVKAVLKMNGFFIKEFGNSIRLICWKANHFNNTDKT